MDALLTKIENMFFEIVSELSMEDIATNGDLKLCIQKIDALFPVGDE